MAKCCVRCGRSFAERKNEGGFTVSRIGKRPVPFGANVEVSLTGNVIRVKGPKGTLERTIPPSLEVRVEKNSIIVERKNDEKETRALHGLYRMLINNMVVGVTTGFTKVLEVKGTGYRFEQKGNKIGFALGFSHPVEMEIPKGITAEVKQNEITLTSADKQLLGDFAAKIRALRPVEPYKAKGISYRGEIIRRKAGKAAAK